jgi:hypothetical protein
LQIQQGQERVLTLLLFTTFGDLEELNRRTVLPPWLIDGNNCRCSSLTAAVKYGCAVRWNAPPQIFLAANRSAEAINYSVPNLPSFILADGSWSSSDPLRPPKPR